VPDLIVLDLPCDYSLSIGLKEDGRGDTQDRGARRAALALYDKYTPHSGFLRYVLLPKPTR
jgi:hypothetical protein